MRKEEEKLPATAAKRHGFATSLSRGTLPEILDEHYAELNGQKNMYEMIQEKLTETLSIELKQWMDPNDEKTKGKILKAVLAFHNSNGGSIFFGVNNDGSYDEDTNGYLGQFDKDKLQQDINKKLDDKIEVELLERSYLSEAQKIIQIRIASGVKYPIALKGSPFNLKPNTLYLRSLNTNDTASSTEAQARDWKRVIDICFENREIEIAHFMKKHGLLEYIKGKDLREENPEPERAIQVKQYLTSIFEKIVKENDITPFRTKLFVHAKIHERTDCANSISELNQFFQFKKNWSGWPFWIDTRRGEVNCQRPELREIGYDAWAFRSPSWIGKWHNLDVWVANFEKGEFSLMRNMQDGSDGERPAERPVYDPFLIHHRISECLYAFYSYVKGRFEHKTFGITFEFDTEKDADTGILSNGFEYVDHIYHEKKTMAVPPVTKEMSTEESIESLKEISIQISQKMLSAFNGMEIGRAKLEEISDKIFKGEH
ncbi:MAG: ATP-binding protein [Bacteroidales bacterium]|nr:ATP-binding protein [Bacteroidales bacterium]